MSKNYYERGRQFDPERIVIGQERLKEINQKLEEILRNCVENLRERYPNLPIDDDLRIDPQQYQEMINSGTIKKDIEKANRLDGNFRIKNKILNKPEDIFTSGEALEIYKTYLLNKILEEKYLIVRASKFDDYKNGVDNIILDINTEEIIAAVDCVADINSDRYKKKKSEIVKKNLGEGVTLKYGLGIDNSKNVIPATNIEGLPIILIALPEVELYKLIEQVDNPNLEGKMADYLFKLIDLMISEIRLQAELSKPKNENELKIRLRRLIRLRDSISQEESY